MASGDLGNLWYTLGIVDKTKDVLPEIVRNIQEELSKNPAKIKIGGIELTKEAAESFIASLSRQAERSAIAARISSFNVDPAAVNSLVSQVTNALSSTAIPLKNFDVSGLKTALAKAVRESVDMAKPTIVERIRQALTSGSSRIKVQVDAKNIAKNIADALAKQNYKISNVTFNGAKMAKQIEDALRGRQFKINIAVDKLSIENAVQAALSQMGLRGIGSFTANDLRLAKANNDALLTADKHAIAQARLAAMHDRAARSTERHIQAQKNISGQMRTTTQIATILGNTIGNVFSVYAVKSFLTEVVRVGGELEKQRLAMGAIMGDTYQASQIYKQVANLSMISPFDVEDLVKYSKQLNAFGIKYSELYDTTKRLSDIAAAVGVDFGRIAYEFGQTSARGWLDGRELRMFANSGIPLLQKLSEYYTKARQEIITAAEVREMITKREVSFQDVKAVLWEMTNAGGEFYQMQEVMAESLAAKWRNLGNAWNLMMGDIAESGLGRGLKMLAEVLTTLTKNWGTVSTVIGLVSAKMAVATLSQNSYNTALTAGTKEALANVQAEQMRISMLKAANGNALYAFVSGAVAGYSRLTKEAFKAAVAEGTLTKAQVQQLIMTRNMPAFWDTMTKKKKMAMLATIGFAEAEAKAALNSSVLAANLGRAVGSIVSMLKAMALNPTTWIFAGISGVIMLYERYKRQADEALQHTEKVAEKAKEGYRNLSELLKSSNLNTMPTNEAGFKAAFDEMKEAIKDYAPDWREIFAEAFGDATHEGIDDMTERYDFLKKKLEEIQESYKILNKLKAIFEGANKDTGGWLELFDDTALTNLKEADDELSKVESMILKASKEIDTEKFINDFAKLNKEYAKWLADNPEKSFYDKLSKAVKDYYSEIQRLRNANAIDSFPELVSALNAMSKFNVSLGDAKEDAKDLADNIERTLMALKSDEFDPKDPKSKRALRMELQVVFDEKGIRQQLADEVFSLLQEKDLVAPLGNYVETIETQAGKGDDEDKNKDKTDHQLKAWQERLRLLKEAYQEYKRWYDLYKNEAEAVAKTKENPLFAGLDVDPSKLKENLETLRDAIQTTTKARRDLQLQVGGEIVTIDYNAIKEQATAIADAMKEQLAEETKRWDLAKKLTEGGVEYEMAVKIAFDADLQVFDKQAREWADRLSAMMFERGMTLNPDEEFGVTFKMNDTDAKKFFGSNGDLYTLWKQTKDHIEKNGIDLYSQSASSLKEFSNIEQRIVAIRNTMEREIASLGGNADAIVVAGIRNKYQWEIDQLKQQFFEGSEVYKRLTQDTTNFGVAKLTELRNLAKSIKQAMDEGTTSTDKNGNIIRSFTYDGKEYQVSERNYENIIKLIARLEKKSQSATESFKKMWKWLSGEDADLKFADVAKDIQNVLNSLSETADQLAQLFGTDTRAGKVASAIGGSFKGLQQITDAFDKFASGDYLGGINGTLQGINTAVSAIKELMPADKNAKLVESMHNMQSAFEKSIDNLSDIMKRQNVDDAYQTYLKQQESMLEEMELTRKGIEDQARAYRDNFFFGSQRNYHSIAKYINDALSDADWSILAEHLGVHNLDELLNLDSSGWYNLITNFKSIWAKIQDAIAADSDNPAAESLADDIEKYAEMWKQMEEQSKEWAQHTIGIAFSDVESAFDSLIKNMSAAWSDYTDSFEEQMYNAIVNYERMNRLGTESEGKLAEYYRKLAEYSTGGYTAEEIAELRAMWDDMAQTSEDIKEDAKALSGWDGGKAASKLSSAIQGVSADQVDLLAAYANGIRGDVSVNRGLMELLVYTMLPSMSVNSSSQLAQLNLIEQHARGIAESNASILEFVNNLDDRLRSVIDGTSKINVK